MPGPRTIRPVCWTTTRRGGSHSVITIVSTTPRCRPPGSGRPVRATIRPCSRRAGPPTSRTSVANIHSPCRVQSVTAAHTRSGGASISRRSTRSRTGWFLLVGGLPEVRGARRVVLHVFRRRMQLRPQGGDLGVALVEHLRELVEQPVDLGHPV